MSPAAKANETPDLETPARRGLSLELGVTCVAVAIIVACARGQRAVVAGPLIACAWILGAFLGPVLRDGDLGRLGLDRPRWLRSLLWALLATVIFVPLGYVGLLLLQQLGWPPAAATAGAPWLTWAAGQLLMIAIPEELFFRGYLQGTLASLVEASPRPARHRKALVVVGSAGLFAVTHILFFWQPGPALVFFPGLVMAWLRLRTGSPLASCLFHAAANVSYPLLWQALQT